MAQDAFIVEKIDAFEDHIIAAVEPLVSGIPLDLDIPCQMRSDLSALFADLEAP